MLNELSIRLLLRANVEETTIVIEYENPILFPINRFPILRLCCHMSLPNLITTLRRKFRVNLI